LLLNLDQKNFCAEITVTVGIAGNLRSYDNATFAAYPPKSGFIINRRAFFLVRVNSDLNNPKGAGGVTDPDLYGGAGTVVFFSSVTLMKVEIKLLPPGGNGEPIRIWENQAPFDFVANGYPNYATDCKLETKFANGSSLPENMVAFSFNFTRAVAFALPKNGRISFTVVADVRANYNDVSKKRFVLATGEDASIQTVNTDVDDDGNGPTDTNVVTVIDTSTGSNGTNTGSNTGSTTTTTSSTTSTTGSTTGTTTTASTTSTASTASTGSDGAYTILASLIIVVIALLI